jgi:hypothetical protein
MNSNRFSAVIHLSLCLLVASGGLAPAASLTRVIGTGDPMPDRPETVLFTGNPVFDPSGSQGNAVVTLQSGMPPVAFTGVYLFDRNNHFQRVVSTETQMPGGGTLPVSTSMLISVYGDTVYFIGVDTTTYKTSLYRVSQPGATPDLIAEQGGAAEGGSFLLFSGVAAHDGGVIFEATYRTSAGESWVDVFNYAANVMSSGLLGKMTIEAPGTSGFQFWNQVSVGVQVGGGRFTCLANAYNSLAFPPNLQGIFALPVPGSSLQGRNVVDTQTTVPGLSAGPGNSFALADLSQSPAYYVVDTDGPRTVFLGRSQGNAAHGVYAWDGDQLQKVADGTTLRPGTSDAFKFTGARFNNAAVAISGARIAFRAQDVNGVAGIYLNDGGHLEEIAADGDQVDGVDLYGMGLTRDAFQGDDILITASGAVWRATLGSTPPPEIQVSIARNLVGWQVSWDAQTASADAILEETANLLNPDWRPVQNPSNPYSFTTSEETRYFRLRQ